MSSKIFQGGQMVLGSLIKIHESSVAKNIDLQYIENNKQNVLRMNRILGAYEQLADLPLDQDLIILPASAIDQLPEGLPFERFCLADPTIKEIITAAKNGYVGGNREAEKPTFEYGSAYYDGCEQFNDWLHHPAKNDLSLSPIISYEKAKMLFNNIMKRSLSRDGKKFKVNGNNMDVIPELLKYFIGDPTSKISLHKSILLFGNTGAGKDQLMKCFQQLLKQILSPYRFDFNPTVSICRKVKEGQKISPYYQKHRCFMDLGFEQKYLYRESEMPVIEEIIFIRSEKSKDILNDSLLLSHGTTNIRFDRLGQVYNERIAARRNEIWTPVWLNGPSLR